MSTLSRTARLYIGAVQCLGLMALATVWMMAPRPASPWPVAMALAAAAVTAPFTIRLPRIGDLSMAFAVVFASLILLGTPSAAIVAATAAAVACAAGRGSRVPLHRVAFNASALALATVTTGALFALAGGRTGALRLARDWPALLLAAGAFFLVNSALAAGASTLSGGIPFVRNWRDNCLWTGPAFLAGSALGLLLALLIRHFGFRALLLALPSFYALHVSLRLYSGHVLRKRRDDQDRDDLNQSVIEALALAIDARDHATPPRLRRVRTLAVEVGRAMGLSNPDLEALRAAALLHDIGKLAVPEYILCKPGILNRDEFEKMAIHPRVGAEILARIRFPYPLASIVRSHHERFDGTGYPDGLAGERIPLPARILSVVLALEALTSERPFRRPLSGEEALERIRAETGTAFDPRVVDTLIANLVRIERIIAPARSTSRTESATPGTTPAAGEHPGPDTSALSPATMADIASAHREGYDLYEIAQGLPRGANLDETMSFISGRIAHLLHYRCLIVYLYHADRRLLRTRFIDGPGPERLAHVEIPLGQRMAGWAALHLMPLAGRFHRDPLRPDAARSDLEELLTAGTIEPMENAIVAPLIEGDELLGVLALYDLPDRPYTTDHLRTLSIAARHVASGVRNALLYEQAQDNALTDPLTNLPNARFLFSSFEKEIERALRTQTPLSVIVLDIDHFKEVNDRFGHTAGDRILRGVARAIRSQLRPGDTCVRYTGDEFILMVRGVGRDDIGAVQARVETAIAHHKFAVARGKALRVTVGMGAATFPEDGRSMERLIALADARMYEQKAAGGHGPAGRPVQNRFIRRRDVPVN